MLAHAVKLQRGPVGIPSAGAPHRARRRLVCRAIASAGGTPGLPSAWVAQCLERAQRTAVQLEDGQHYIPLSEAQRWFKAGQHEGDAQHAEHLNAVLAEQGRVEAEMRNMSQAVLREHDEHEQGMLRLLNYALKLEAEVEAAKLGMKEAAMEAAHEAEEKLLLQYQQMLLEYEAAHEAESHAVEQSLRGQVKHLEKMLRVAHEAKKAWRARALQAEEQFTQLRGLIQAAWRSEVAAQRAAGAAGEGGAQRRAPQPDEEQPPPPLHKDPRIRSTATISSADADVSTAHPHEPGTHHRVFKPLAGKKKPLRAAEPHGEMHSL